jgi:hypothetical protein
MVLSVFLALKWDFGLCRMQMKVQKFPILVIMYSLWSGLWRPTKLKILNVAIVVILSITEFLIDRVPCTKLEI